MNKRIGMLPLVHIYDFDSTLLNFFPFFLIESVVKKLVDKLLTTANETDERIKKSEWIELLRSDSLYEYVCFYAPMFKLIIRVLPILR